MADNASRRGATDLSLPLMVVAFVVIGGFLYWLYGQAQAEAALAVVEDEAAEEMHAEGGTAVAPEDIQMDATPYEGQVVRLVGVNIASMLGTQGFWLEMPNGNPFLVSMSEEVMAQGLALAMNTRVTVVGMMTVMTEEIAQSWLDAGAITDGDMLAASFATHYIDAEAVEIGSGGGGMDEPDEGN